MRTVRGRWAGCLIAIGIVVQSGTPPAWCGQADSARAVGRPVPVESPVVIIRAQHRRLTFAQDIKRLAVGDAEVVSADLITSREVLALGKKTGRTSLIVWFADGQLQEFLVAVQQDLSVLEDALRRVHPSLRVQSAPDRDALILTGRVPDKATSQLAEAVAQHYLDAGSGRQSEGGPVVAAPAAGGLVVSTEVRTGTQAAAAEAELAQAPATGRVQGAVRAVGTIINLIELDALPPLPEEKVLAAIRSIGGADVTVRRVMSGSVRDDTRDTLVLEGRVPSQVALVRVLTVAAQVFAGRTPTQDDIRVVADEAGALAQAGQGQSQGQDQSMGGGASSAMFGGARGSRLSNQVRSNLARAKVVDVAGGRVLSFIEVTDLPQVRVQIRLQEVNRSRLRSLASNSAALTSSFRQPSLNPAQSAEAAQGDQAARVGAFGAAIQNVLSFLNGILLNQVQYAGANYAIDWAFSMLEREGISRSLSSPSITVLSGEVAQVQVGGEVPVPSAFAPALGGAAGAAGVFSSVQFVPFGVQLQIRPLVGDDDTITIDVQPQIVTPDALLTDVIRQSTGSSVPTTAFQTRGLRTSSRLRDGEALVIGGLLSSNSAVNATSPPWIARVPLLGRLFENSNNNEQSTELVVVVSPVVLRTPPRDVGLWEFPGPSGRGGHTNNR